MRVSRKHRQMREIERLLEVYQVLDSVIHLDSHEYGIYEKQVREALLELEKENLSLNTLYMIEKLLDGVLSQALNRDPSLPWLAGAKKVSANVGNIK